MHPYGWLSLTPPLVAIVLAIVTRRVLVSLMAGILWGALLTANFNPFVAIEQTLETHLWQALIEEDNLRVAAFTLFMGAMVGIISRSGAMQDMVTKIARLASTRKRGQATGWLLGLVVFFDDYANTILLGHTLRPLFDRLKISREKLAYIVDSTAAADAGLALVSTWVATELAYLGDGLLAANAPADVTPLQLFLDSIPYRFYSLLALFFVGAVALTGRDFGPMLRAERRALRGIKHDEGAFVADEEDPHGTARWPQAALAIGVTITAVIALLYSTGCEALRATNKLDNASLTDIFGAANSNYALVWGALAGLVVAVVIARLTGALAPKAIGDAAARGAVLMLPALAILWFASTLSSLSSDKPLERDEPRVAIAEKEGNAFPIDYRLYTGDYLKGFLEESQTGSLLPALLPTLVFVLASITSFATGSSWGTMGLLAPLCVQLAYSTYDVNGVVDPHDPAFLATIGAVLAGAIFGDHCSPISDTTILSSQASACDHVAHVNTQLPYALLTAAVCIVCGTLPAGFGLHGWWCLLFGAIALVSLLYILGRRAEEANIKSDAA